MKNLVTVDFDIIMAPSIYFYEFVSTTREWDEILEYPLGKVLNPDFILY